MMKAILLCFGALTVAAQTSDYKEARTLYYQGADGNDKAYEEAERILKPLADHPNADPKARAYYGSLRLLDAAHTWAVWKKNGLSKEGIGLLDSAVASAPDDLEVRFVRAITTFRLPSFFGRKEQSKSDFNLLADHVLANNRGDLEPRLAAASLYYHAEFLKEADQKEEAVKLWKQAIEIAPDSRAARESKAELP